MALSSLASLRLLYEDIVQSECSSAWLELDSRLFVKGGKQDLTAVLRGLK